MTERRADPETRGRLLEGAARLLTGEGPAALTLRRVATEADTSTMAVYTHFGSMADLADAVVAEGFARLAALLAAVPHTDDALTDMAGLARAYVINARQNPDLYAVMFGTASLGKYRPESADKRVRGRDTFQEIVKTSGRAVEQGRLRPAEPLAIASQLWTAMHGFVMLDAGGYFGEDAAEQVLVPMLVNLLSGLGADPGAALASIRTIAAPGGARPGAPRRAIRGAHGRATEASTS